jgi:hypothetical protein
VLLRYDALFPLRRAAFSLSVILKRATGKAEGSRMRLKIESHFSIRARAWYAPYSDAESDERYSGAIEILQLRVPLASE